MTQGIDIFANHKLAKSCLLALHNFVNEKNRERFSLIKIRAVLSQNPNLKKPIFVLKNVLLYRYFKNLQIRTNVSKCLKQKQNIARYAAYLKL